MTQTPRPRHELVNDITLARLRGDRETVRTLEAELALHPVDDCPGCGEPLRDSEEHGDVVTYDGLTINGEWHELCADRERNDPYWP